MLSPYTDRAGEGDEPGDRKSQIMGILAQGLSDLWFSIIFTAISRAMDYYPISQMGKFCTLWTSLLLLLVLKVQFHDRRSNATPKPYVYHHVTLGGLSSHLGLQFPYEENKAAHIISRAFYTGCPETG